MFNTGDFERDFRAWIVGGVAFTLIILGSALIIDDLRTGEMMMAAVVVILPVAMLVVLMLLAYGESIEHAAKTLVVAMLICAAVAVAASGGQATGPYVVLPMTILIALITTTHRFALGIAVVCVLLPIAGVMLANSAWQAPIVVDADRALWGVFRLSIFCSLLTLLCMLLFRKSADRLRTKLEKANVLQSHNQKLEAIGTLAAGISHEINTPVQYVADNFNFVSESCQSLLDCIETISAKVSTSSADDIDSLKKDTQKAFVEADVEFVVEELPRALEEAAEGLNRIKTIVGAMKEFSHPGVAEKTRVDLNKCIQSTLVVCGNRWKYAADMETSYDDQLPMAFCLPDEINQVFLNIIVNAADSIQEKIDEGGVTKGRISIETSADDEYIEVRISDTGRGIPEDIVRRVFDPFFTTKEVGKGTGQGLAISHDVVVNRHAGELLCESVVGDGTTFRIRLPLNDDCFAEEAATA